MNTGSSDRILIYETGSQNKKKTETVKRQQTACSKRLALNYVKELRSLEDKITNPTLALPLL
jgi:hypothetical protein